MDLRDKTVLILGGAGLVGIAVARKVLENRPKRIVLGSLRQADAEAAAAQLAAEPLASGITVDAVWGDLFVPHAMKDLSRKEILADPELRRQMVDDLYGEFTPEVVHRSTLGRLLEEVSPEILVDCINTAGALAYQNVFASVNRLRAAAAEGKADTAAVEEHLALLYLPQLIRHTQIALEGMKRAGTEVLVKVGTAGTGGMGLNIPFTHSEERPSRVLLAKSGIAGAQTLFLYLMARTPGGPAVKEVKPTAAISWKSIARGPVNRAGKPIQRADAVAPLSLSEAFGDGAAASYRETGEVLEGVYLDAGENGLFTLGEFETLTALGLMEFVTPEEIASNVIREILSHATGRDVVAALDAATLGPTYRAGALRSAALDYMERLEAEAGIRSVAYEMLGPPRLAKLLFEGEILARLYGTVEAVAALDADDASARAHALIQEDADLRQRSLSIGIPILLPDGENVLRGPQVRVVPEPSIPLRDQRLVDRGWVDLRPKNFVRWKDRCAGLLRALRETPGIESGSVGDFEYGDAEGKLRPGRMAAWIFRYEDKGERIKR